MTSKKPGIMAPFTGWVHGQSQSSPSWVFILSHPPTCRPRALGWLALPARMPSLEIWQDLFSFFQIQPECLFLQETLPIWPRRVYVVPQLLATMPLSCTDFSRLSLSIFTCFGKHCRTCLLAQALHVAHLSRSKVHLQQLAYALPVPSP